MVGGAGVEEEPTGRSGSRQVDWWKVRCREEGAEGVFGADGGRLAVEDFERPGNVEGGVIPEDAAFAGRVVEVGGFVEDFGGVREDEEAVGEAFGDPEKLEIFVGGLCLEVETGPFAEVGGVAAQVDGHIPDATGEYADELALGLAQLVVETAEDAFGGEGLVVLDELRGEASGGEG